jgi:hypothetical protein
MNVFVTTVIRAILLGLGVLTGDKGWEDEEFIQMGTGFLLGAGALVWGILEKKQLIKRGANPSAKVRLRKKGAASVADDAILGTDPHERRRRK